MSITIIFYIFFFFSSRRRHTRYWRDWSSAVCSSDLCARRTSLERCACATSRLAQNNSNATAAAAFDARFILPRSEERRVGKGVDLGGRRIIKKKKTSLYILHITFNNYSTYAHTQGSI